MELLILLVVLVCPVVMGGMMIWMTRSVRRERRSGDGRGMGRE